MIYMKRSRWKTLIQAAPTSCSLSDRNLGGASAPMHTSVLPLPVMKTDVKPVPDSVLSRSLRASSSGRLGCMNERSVMSPWIMVNGRTVIRPAPVLKAYLLVKRGLLKVIHSQSLGHDALIGQPFEEEQGVGGAAPIEVKRFEDPGGREAHGGLHLLREGGTGGL